MTPDEVSRSLLAQIRTRYAGAAAAVVEGHTNAEVNDALQDGEPAARTDTCCTGTDGGSETAFGAARYDVDDQRCLPPEALAASLGCGNPAAVAALRPGERVLDLGSGGGIDVLLSARRVGESGFAYGVDMTEEMVDLARANAARAGATNVEFLLGTIEEVPLPDDSVDVVISNCVVNLSVDKPAVLAEMHRVLTPGGRLGISDVVAEDHLDAAARAERGTYVGCIAGALSRQELLDGLTAAGFVDAEVEFTHEAVPGMHAAVVRATKPDAIRTTAPPGSTG